jgi:hypothetical protein
MLQRISAAIAAGRRAAGQPDAPVLSTDPAARPVQPGWALVHFGDPADTEALLPAHVATCRARRFRCLLLTDDMPSSCVGSRDVVVEFLPWPAAFATTTPGGFAAALDHSFRRLALSLIFWDVVGCDWQGSKARALLDMAPDWAHPVVRAAQAVQRNHSQIQDRVIG